MEIEEMNHWWTEKEVRPQLLPKTKRELFNAVKADVDRRQIQVIVGLRRVGKSTIFYQLIDYLIKKGVNPLNILYLTFDEPNLQEKRVGEILKEYSRLTDVDYRKEKVYLFLDEAQKSKEWVADVKMIYDSLPNIKIFISGSASLNILSDAKKTLAGRTIYYELKPLSFEEFLKIKGIRIEDKRFMLYKETLEKEFEKFLLRPFPELVAEKDEAFIKNYIRNSVIEPVILRDIPKEFEGVDILLLEKLVNIFLSNPGQYLRVDELAKELGRAKITLYQAIFYLEFSFLIRRVLNFRPSIKAASRKLSRVYAYHPSLLLPFNPTEENFAENLVLFELDAKHYWRDREKEIDFLKDCMPVEVKFKTRIDKQDTRWIEFFLKKYGKKLDINKGFIITKDVDGRINNIRLLPLWQFCLKGLT
jgi:predicted AAA+ superfamily ATPase